MNAASFHIKHLYMQLHPLLSPHKPNSLFLTTYTNETVVYDKLLVFLEHLHICENHRKCTPQKKFRIIRIGSMRTLAGQIKHYVHEKYGSPKLANYKFQVWSSDTTIYQYRLSYAKSRNCNTGKLENVILNPPAKEKICDMKLNRI